MKNLIRGTKIFDMFCNLTQNVNEKLNPVLSCYLIGFYSWKQEFCGSDGSKSSRKFPEKLSHRIKRFRILKCNKVSGCGPVFLEFFFFSKIFIQDCLCEQFLVYISSQSPSDFIILIFFYNFNAFVKPVIQM